MPDFDTPAHAHLRSSDELAAWTQALVRVPSPQTELMEAEPAVLEYLAGPVSALLRDTGLKPRRSPMGDLIVELDGETDGPTVLLVAYAMTHPASSMRDPYSGELVHGATGTAVRGRGAAEQKGALAASIAAVAAAGAVGLDRGRLVFAVSTAGETGRHDSIKAILSDLDRQPSFAVVAIGTGNRIALGNKGRVDFDVVVTGKACHSSTPWLGVNAIDGARLVLDRLAGIDLSGRRHPELGSASLTATHIATGPNATHTVQNIARITFDRRLLPGDDPAEALTEIESALAGIDPVYGIEIRPGPMMYPAEIAPDGILMAQLRRGFEACGQAMPEAFFSHSALDAGYLLDRGCEAAMWGPGEMSLFHTDEELVPVAAVRRSAEDYLTFIHSTLGLRVTNGKGGAA